MARVTDAIFKLDTGSFDELIEKSAQLSERMGELKNELDGMKNQLMFTWAGQGRNTFEKKYRLISQQFGDLRDDLRQISEDIYTFAEEYMQADVDAAKALDGVDNRY